MVEVLLAPGGAPDPRSAFARLREAPRLVPFGATQVDFAAGLATRLLSDPSLRAFPDLVALGYWMRPARIEELRLRFQRVLDGDLAAARGLVLHYAPSNVDTIFAYSWLLALVTGNANVVRVSTRRDRTAEILLAQVGEVLARPAFADMKERTLVVSFDHDAETNRDLAAACDLRVIWGGDDAIRRIREAPLPPSATDLVFPDRFSLAVFRAEAFLSMDAPAWDRFLHDFANDVLTYGQMACSSPRHIAWIGSRDATERARTEFWRKFLPRIRERDEGGWSQPVSSRLTAACRTALFPDTTSVEVDFEPPVTRLEVRRLTSDMRAIHPGGGFFLESAYASLSELAPDVSAKDQTLVCHGFEREQLARFSAELPAGGGDRIVRVGAALEFSHVWDGQDLLQAFTRRIGLSV